MRPIGGAELSSVPTGSARTAALRQHVRDMPAPIIVVTLSDHLVTTVRTATQVGVTWSRYAPGDHTRTGELLNTRAHQSGGPTLGPPDCHRPSTHPEEDQQI
jgi:hypothetical protein